MQVKRWVKRHLNIFVHRYRKKIITIKKQQKWSYYIINLCRNSITADVFTQPWPGKLRVWAWTWRMASVSSGRTAVWRTSSVCCKQLDGLQPSVFWPRRRDPTADSVSEAGRIKLEWTKNRDCCGTRNVLRQRNIRLYQYFVSFVTVNIDNIF